PLLTTADGAKFGKSAGNAIWLDATMTSAYAYYQYWINTADADVPRFLRLFTHLGLDEIDRIEAVLTEDPAARVAHRELAREATRIIHGDDGVRTAEQATEALFGEGSFEGLDDATLDEVLAEAPSVDVPRTRLDEGLGLLELLTAVGASRSNSEARRLVDQGAVRLDNVVESDAGRTLTDEDLAGRRTLVLRVGRRRHFLARFR
ncbi:MAG: tyrosine--tRNA ligase, partial [Nitriliruptoraceae bacterium]